MRTVAARSPSPSCSPFPPRPARGRDRSTCDPRHPGRRAAGGLRGALGRRLRALQIRSRALNERYGLNSKGPSAAELRALQIRSQALNQRYGLGTFATIADARAPDTIDASVTAHTPVVTVMRSPDFAWGDFGAGIGAAFAAIVLIGLAVLAGRRNSKNRTIATA